MKQFYFLASAIFFTCFSQGQTITFPDANLKAKLLASTATNGFAKDVNGASIKIDVNSNSQIEVSEALNVYQLIINNINSAAGVKITNLTGISNFTNLTRFECQDNLVSSFDASVLQNLQYLALRKNKLTTLNVSGLSNLTFLICSDNLLTSLNLSGLSALQEMSCQTPNAITSLNINGCSGMKSFICQGNLVGNIDFSQMPNLETMYVGYCGITAIDLTGLVSLKVLQASSNEFPTLTLTGLTSLEEVVVFGGQIQNVEAHNLPNVFNLNLTGNPLANVDLLNLPALVNLDCSYGNLTELSLAGGFPSLTDLNFRQNNISSVDLSGLAALYSLFCEDNQLTSLDLSQNTNVTFVHCEDNMFDWINAKNGKDEDLFMSGNSATLRYICADESQIAYLLANAVVNEITNCEINTYCSFVPGGISYAVAGTNRLDVGNNGCDVADPVYPRMKFSLASDTSTGAFISNNSGSYSIPLPAGTHTITPVLENPSYFTVTPVSISVTFPEQSSPFQQNFCIAGNGSHPDLEIMVMPLSLARPGFDAHYKIIIRNKGNVAQSGAVSISFNGLVSDFVTASPSVSSQTTNSLTWNFTGLNLYETREILFTLNLNSPMETPPLNLQETLNFTAQITSALTDDTPQDNSVALAQLVTNSLDPNNKICLEGAAVLPSIAGQYVHYVINFENSGTANAQNIVVKDMIDTAKFDVNSLVPLSGSHSFFTRISASNKVEFIFENINLPFDDANNDGYVAFKIKTKPTLVVGNSFSNNASIYFDYNFPIVTDPAVTTIQLLENPDFEFSKYFTLYPNPAKNVLNIQSTNGVEVRSISIYNMLGQLLQVDTKSDNQASVDVSGLQSGNYLLKISSDKGSSNAKFVKR
jgi:hypothetical protein